MARNVIASQVFVGPYPVLPVTAGSAAVNFAAGHVANGNAINFNQSNRVIVFVRNTDAANQTVTFTSMADERNRTGDITNYSIPPAGIAAFVFERAGWRQADNMLYVNVSNAAVQLAATLL